MHTPRKRFGQHFLNDKAVIHRIIEWLAPQSGEHLIEIGPGQGALTIPVLKKVKQLEVVELDRDLIPILKKRSESLGVIQIHQADALKLNFNEFKTDDRQLRVFGNLPYNISTPLIFHLLSFAPIISDMLFMLQKEVAQRLAAPPNTEDYGRLSVMVQYFCQVEFLDIIPPTAFYPPPQVDSAMVRLVPYGQLPYLANNLDLFTEIVRRAFGQRRKTLRNSLKDFISDDKWLNIPVHSDARPENLSLKDFVAIANVLNNQDSHK